MSLFGNDEQQDKRLDEQDKRIQSLEVQLRGVVHLVQQNQMDIASLNLAMVSLHSQLKDKLSTDHIDPAFESLNDEIKTAREDLKKMSEAVDETWEPIQQGLSESLSRVREQVENLKSKQ